MTTSRTPNRREMTLLNKYPRTLASSTIVLCLVPLSLGLFLVLGEQVARIAGALSTGLWRGVAVSDLQLKMGQSALFIAAHGCAVLGLAALWSTLTPTVCGNLQGVLLRPWHRLGLKLGIAVSLAYVLMFALKPDWHIVSLLVVLLFVWPAVVAADMLRGSKP